MYIKGAERTCADIPADVAPSVALCEVTHNAAGREAHTMTHFILRFYATLPRVSIFAQGDALHLMHHSRLRGLHRLRSAAALASWVAAVEAAPLFSDEVTCLCSTIVEDWWNPCPEVAPFPEGTPRCYGDTYWPMVRARCSCAVVPACASRFRR